MMATLVLNGKITSNHQSLGHSIKNSQNQPPDTFYKKKAVLKNFAVFLGKHLCLESLYDEVAGIQAFRLATLLKRYSNIGVFL